LANVKGIIGADVTIEVEGVVIAGQRDAKLSGSTDMIDITCKTDYPNKVVKPGWSGEDTIECDALLCAGSVGGLAYWYNLALAQEPVTVVLTLGDGNGTVVTGGAPALGGDTFTGEAYVQKPDMSAPQAGEGTMSLKFTISGGLTATSVG
jgi:hypothetical protein